MANPGLRYSDFEQPDLELHSVYPHCTNFALAPKKIPAAEIVATVENGISALPVEDKLVLRSQVTQILQRASAPPPNLPQAELRALHNLRKDQDRLVIPADKGNCTVMDTVL